jgi:outer membrane cobalamin receptor
MTSLQPRIALLSLVSAALVCAATASAQSVARPAAPATDEEPLKLETFTVTGSNIRRVDAETALPVTVFERSDLDARGASTMAELFETLGAAEISANLRVDEIGNSRVGAEAPTGELHLA